MPWMVMTAVRWNTLTVTPSFPLFPEMTMRQHPAEGMYAFAPVFNTRQAAEKWNEGRHPIMEIRERDAQTPTPEE